MDVGKQNLWFLEALKCSISKFVLPEETCKGIKTVFFKIEVTPYISETLNLGVEITMSNSALYYENLPEFASDSIKYCLELFVWQN